MANGADLLNLILAGAGSGALGNLGPEFGQARSTEMTAQNEIANLLTQLTQRPKPTAAGLGALGGAGIGDAFTLAAAALTNNPGLRTRFLQNVAGMQEQREQERRRGLGTQIGLAEQRRGEARQERLGAVERGTRLTQAAIERQEAREAEGRARTFAVEQEKSRREFEAEQAEIDREFRMEIEKLRAQPDAAEALENFQTIGYAGLDLANAKMEELRGARSEEERDKIVEDAIAEYAELMQFSGVPESQRKVLLKALRRAIQRRRNGLDVITVAPQQRITETPTEREFLQEETAEQRERRQGIEQLFRLGRIGG